MTVFMAEIEFFREKNSNFVNNVTIFQKIIEI